MNKVMNHLVAFIYPSGTESPEINEWDRLAFEKFLGSIMNRLRKFKGVKSEETIQKEIAKAEREAKKAVRDAKKAAQAKRKPAAKTKKSK